MDKRITYPKRMPQTAPFGVEHQARRTHEHMLLIMKLTHLILATIGILTLILFLHARTEAHFRTQFNHERTQQARVRAEAQARASALEAMEEERMSILPLVLKRTRDFINK